MTATEALAVLRAINEKHKGVGDTWLERIAHELDLQQERILELEMDVAYWQEKYEELKEGK